MIGISDFKGYPNDGRVRLIKTLGDYAGFYVCDGDPIYARVVDRNNGCGRESETACLRLSLGAKLRPINDCDLNEQNADEALFDLIRLTNWNSEREFAAYIELCEMHAHSNTLLTFEEFFYSLEEIFHPNREQSKLNACGLYCELAFMEAASLSVSGDIDPSLFWQRDGSTSKYDFTFPNGNIEVKSSSKDHGVLIKHDQLFNSDKNYLAAVCIERNPGGETLIDLADRLMASECFFQTLESRTELNRRLLQIEPRDLGKRMKIRFIEVFEEAHINPFDVVTDRVTQLTYRLDLSGMQHADLREVVQGMLGVQV